MIPGVTFRVIEARHLAAMDKGGMVVFIYLFLVYCCIVFLFIC